MRASPRRSSRAPQVLPSGAVRRSPPSLSEEKLVRGGRKVVPAGFQEQGGTGLGSSPPAD